MNLNEAWENLCRELDRPRNKIMNEEHERRIAYLEQQLKFRDQHITDLKAQVERWVKAYEERKAQVFELAELLQKEQQK